MRSDTVELRTLGNSGLVVSSYALGTMTFGKETAEADAWAILDRFVAAGGNLIDIADVYVGGESERIVGRWLADRGRHDDVVIATKGRFPTGDGPNDHGLSRAHLYRAVDASLERLQIDHIDLYQVHAWDPLTPAEEWLATLEDLVRAGKIRYVGVSNLTGWQLQRVALLTRHARLSPVVSLQPQYNLLTREIEWELVPVCELEGIGMLPWSPLGGGWLTGKYRRDVRPTGPTRLGEDPERGVEAYDRRNTDRTWQILDVVSEIADSHSVTMSQVALAWVTAQPQVDATILGVRTLEQLEDNLGAVDLTLTTEDAARLDEVSRPVTPSYPYEVFGRMVSGRRNLIR
jgi:aryl-alcohol dehydrogenase-like predicted oxidoreductase